MIRSLSSFFTFIFFLTGMSQALAYRDVPVMIHLGATTQHDTIGFNLVKELSHLFYASIVEEKLPLWDSPKKDIRISGETLRALENSSRTSFENATDLFIYELWTSTKKSTEFRILGFSFVNRNDSGERTVYGFIDLKDAEKLLAGTAATTTNANGSFPATCEDLLLSRNYHFDIVQFGDESFQKDPARSFELKQEAFYSRKQVVGKIQLPASKLLTYTITPKKYTTDDDLSNDLCDALRTLLNENAELFYNNGGSYIISHLEKKKIPAITRVVVTETITKKPNGFESSNFYLQLFFGEKSMKVMAVDDLEKCGIFINFQTISGFLRSQGCYYELQKINHQDILPAEQAKYLRALKEKHWSYLTLYVKNY